MQLVTVCLEWDYGQEHVAFTSLEKAQEWVNNQEVDDGEGKILTYQDLIDDGLCSFRTITLDP